MQKLQIKANVIAALEEKMDTSIFNIEDAIKTGKLRTKYLVDALVQAGKESKVKGFSAKEVGEMSLTDLMQTFMAAIGVEGNEDEATE